MVAGQGATARRSAASCRFATPIGAWRCASEHGLADFDLAYAHEARARALKALGDDIAAGESWELAKSVPIADPEDQAILDADLAVAL